MRVAILATNMIRLEADAAKGTELFVHSYVKSLMERIRKDNLPVDVTVFASGDSDVPTTVESVARLPSMNDPVIGLSAHKPFELALVSKAFTMEDRFDVYHVHLSNGEYVLPFLPFVKKPVIITMHGGAPSAYVQQFFDLYKGLPNVHFVAISDNQRTRLPDLPYVATVHHGIDIAEFPFDEHGGETMMWAGRGIPDKGLDVVLSVAEATGKPTAVYPILKSEHVEWLKTDILSRRRAIRQKSALTMDFDITRTELAGHYRQSKVFLFPIMWEEPFGLVMAESMASGTPVVAYARGSAPELIEDGVTGFVVNPCDEDIRGSFTVKKTGLAGLLEAIDRIYALPSDDYMRMRRACRERVEKLFPIDRMVSDYLNLYAKFSPAG
jgi:glycosyltransferase involved in cell wall biosynthesis